MSNYSFNITTVELIRLNEKSGTVDDTEFTMWALKIQSLVVLFSLFKNSPVLVCTEQCYHGNTSSILSTITETVRHLYPSGDLPSLTSDLSVNSSKPPTLYSSPASVARTWTSSGKPWWVTVTSTETERSRRTSWLSASASNSANGPSQHSHHWFFVFVFFFFSLFLSFLHHCSLSPSSPPSSYSLFKLPFSSLSSHFTHSFSHPHFWKYISSLAGSQLGVKRPMYPHILCSLI